MVRPCSASRSENIAVKVLFKEYRLDDKANVTLLLEVRDF